jgi:DNA/RNA-binding domain of Phe-tRNA-synthetase-like protein
MAVDNDATEDVDNLILMVKEKYTNFVPLTEVVTIPKIKVSRDGYKKLGKDPSHTRLACEALLRRMIKGDDLYRLGDIIDLGNILSIETMRSVCVVDLDKIEGDVTIRIGTKDDIYFGINRGQINVDKIPLYTDKIGPFGNPTSDTDRTKVTSSTENILIMIICFNQEDMEKDEEILLSLYQKYANARNINKLEVR